MPAPDPFRNHTQSRAVALKQQRNGVTHHEYPDRAVTKFTSSGNIRGPVTRIHITNTDHIGRTKRQVSSLNHYPGLYLPWHLLLPTICSFFLPPKCCKPFFAKKHDGCLFIFTFSVLSKLFISSIFWYRQLKDAKSLNIAGKRWSAQLLP